MHGTTQCTLYCRDQPNIRKPAGSIAGTVYRNGLAYSDHAQPSAFECCNNHSQSILRLLDAILVDEMLIQAIDSNALEPRHCCKAASERDIRESSD